MKKMRNQTIYSTRTTKGDQEPHEESFCKIMLSNFSNHLLIPHAFVEKYPGVFPSKITLTTRDGKKTQVSSVKLQNKVLLKACWSDFVKDSSISFGDFLVFNVVSDSEYHVMIFKKNGCEESILNQKAIRVIEIDSGSACTTDEDKTDNEIRVIDIDSGSGCTADKHKTSKEIGRAEKLRRVMKAKARADFFSSKHPFFKARITKTYLKGHHLHIPAEFVKRYLGKDSRDVTLQMAKRLWPARLTFQRNNYGGYIWLDKGWNAFAKDNNLHCDDICAFELIKGTKIVLKATIFRSTC